jgi:flagellar motor switch protein FliM
MSKDFLSQDEVDALLRGVAGETDEQAPSEDASLAQPYNLATHERVVRGRMPTLEMINERFARQLRTGLFNFVRRSADISIGPVRVQKFSDFSRDLQVPTNLNLVHVKPLRGTALFVLDPKLIFLIIDNMFGGNGQIAARVEARDFTPTEMRIVQRLLDVVFDEYQKAWLPVHEVKFEYLRSEMNTQFANIAAPNEIVVVTTLTIEFSGAGGELHICMPYAMIEPIRDLLYSNMLGEHLEADKRWMRMLSLQVQSAEVELVVNLGHTNITLGQILNMEVNDVLSFHVPEPMLAEVDGVPVMECKCGIFSEQYAIKVERMLSSSPAE